MQDSGREGGEGVVEGEGEVGGGWEVGGGGGGGVSHESWRIRTNPGGFA